MGPELSEFGEDLGTKMRLGCTRRCLSYQRVGPQKHNATEDERPDADDERHLITQPGAA